MNLCHADNDVLLVGSFSIGPRPSQLEHYRHSPFQRYRPMGEWPFPHFGAMVFERVAMNRARLQCRQHPDQRLVNRQAVSPPMLKTLRAPRLSFAQDPSRGDQLPKSAKSKVCVPGRPLGAVRFT